MYEYRVGGSLGTTDPTYIERKADVDLYHALRDGEFCYVLTSRQMGKSSLRMRTRSRLEKQGMGSCASIDMTRIGSENVTPHQWYQGIAFALLRQFELSKTVDLKQWWTAQGDIPSIQKFGQFIETCIFPSIPRGHIFIFLDEIDSVKSLPFSVDDFFSFIRFCYNQRSENADYQRLTWALFGVAAPSDLIADPRRTPFNIGRAITLPGFSLEEAYPLAQGLMDVVDNPQQVLREILRWTNGQPFLTQKLGYVIQMMGRSSGNGKVTIPPKTEAAWMENMVRSHIVENWETQDDPEHLRTIRDRLLRNDELAGRLLGLYQRIHHQRFVLVEDCAEQRALCLAGIATLRQGHVEISNPIYAHIFNLGWVNRQLSQRRPYAAAFQSWVDSSGKDESRLLGGNALQESLAWSHGKSLSDLDYQFLAASQELDNRMMRMQLEAADKAKQVLAEAQQKAKRLLFAGYLSLGLCIALSIASVVISRMFIE
ncbi:MAG: AAA-like domain-containing protein [Cyanobacteria bacterium P01_E01_bin.6]